MKRNTQITILLAGSIFFLSQFESAVFSYSDGFLHQNIGVNKYFSSNRSDGDKKEKKIDFLLSASAGVYFTDFFTKSNQKEYIEYIDNMNDNVIPQVAFTLGSSFSYNALKNLFTELGLKLSTQGFSTQNFRYKTESSFESITVLKNITLLKITPDLSIYYKIPNLYNFFLGVGVSIGIPIMFFYSKISYSNDGSVLEKTGIVPFKSKIKNGNFFFIGKTFNLGNIPTSIQFEIADANNYFNIYEDVYTNQYGIFMQVKFNL